MSEENNPDKEEKSETEYRCPHCGKPISYVYKVPHRNQYVCPLCKMTIKRTQLPKDIKIKPMEAPDEEEEEEQTPEELAELFPTIKEPWQVLSNTLRMYGVRERVIDALVRRAKMRSGGAMHPMELVEYLLTLKSGIKERKLAEFIAEDYRYALENEMHKAEKLGTQYIIPFDVTPKQETPKYIPGVPPRQETQYPRYYPEYPRQTTVYPYPQTQTSAYPPRYPPQTPLPNQYPYRYGDRPSPPIPKEKPITKEDVAKIVIDTMKKIEAEKKKKTEMSELKEMMYALHKEIEDIKNNPPSRAGGKEEKPLTEDKIKQMIEDSKKDETINQINELKNEIKELKKLRLKEKTEAEKDEIKRRLVSMHNEIKSIKDSVPLKGADAQTTLAIRTLDTVDRNVRLLMKYWFEGGKRRKPEYEEGEEAEAPPEDYVPEDYIEEE